MAEWWPFDRVRAAAQSLGLPTPGVFPGDPFSVLVDAARAFLVGRKRIDQLRRRRPDHDADRHLHLRFRRRPAGRPVRPGPLHGAGRPVGRPRVREAGGPGQERPPAARHPAAAGGRAGAGGGVRHHRGRVPLPGLGLLPARADRKRRRPAGRRDRRALAAAGGGDGRGRRVAAGPAARAAPVRAAAGPVVPGLPPAGPVAAQRHRADLGRSRPRRLHGARHAERMAALRSPRRPRPPADRNPRQTFIPNGAGSTPRARRSPGAATRRRPAKRP